MADTLKVSCKVEHFSGIDLNTDPTMEVLTSWVTTADDLDYYRTRFDLQARADGELQIPVRDLSGQIYLLGRNFGRNAAELFIPTRSLATEDGINVSEGDTIIQLPAGGFCFAPISVDLTSFPPMYAWGVGGTTSIELLLFGKKTT